MAEERLLAEADQQVFMGPEDYVMDSQPCHQYELTQEQERQNIRVVDNAPLEISWSFAGIAPYDD